MSLRPGDPAPDFSLPCTDGTTWSLATLRDKRAVLYFYPKDDTPGCTKQACSFRDHHDAILAAGAVVVGISRDSMKAHERFRTKYNLPFPLLTDGEGAMTRAYGAWGEKVLYGKKSEGVIRTTVVIAPDGTIERWDGKVRAAEDGERTLQFIAGA